ncbi:MAG: sensor histidine kinase [Akkermansiaceae bacterium]|nr:sensor histidine kinase [Akkermansiaceae bacterium]
MRCSRRILCCLLIASSCPAAEPALITSGLALHRLPRTQAPTGIPLRITGVVTDPGISPESGFILDDGTRGVFVLRNSASRPSGDTGPPDDPVVLLQAGMKVEVIGVTGAGHFAPEIEADSLRILGTAPMPPAKRVRIPALLTGTYDCQRVTLRGVLQDAGGRYWFDNRARLVLATLEGRCEIILSQTEAPKIGALLDAEVEISGVCCTFCTPRGELAGIRVHLSGTEEIKVILPPPPDPFGVPEADITALRSFSVSPPSLHRRQFRGTVTYSAPGEFFYVQNGTRGVRVYCRQTTPLPPGTRVLVSGFIELQQPFAEISQAVFRVEPSAAPIAPLAITRAEVLGHFSGYQTDGAVDVDGRLVSLNGRLLQMEPMERGTRLFVESGGAVTTAEITAPASASQLADLRLGSGVRLTGICLTELSSAWPAQDIPRITGFHLLLRGAEDIEVTSLASWWTTERLWKALAGLFAVFMLALAWALYLRRRVDQERYALAEEERAGEAASAEFAATMRERERLAADLHDTLEQALTGVAFQLETMHRLRDHPAELSRRHLFLARQILSGSREDVRRSVWNLRANVLEGRLLREALAYIASGLGEGSGITFATGGTGEERELPDLVAGNLLMLAKECVTNALKHSSPTLISPDVDYEPELVTLTVSDDGCGFDLEHAKGPLEGHFGLQGMRERSVRLSGDLEINSSPGGGTKVIIRVNPKIS